MEIELSIVIPVYHAADCIEELVMEIKEVLTPELHDFEVILVDDGSKDDSWNRIKLLKRRFPFVCGIRLNRNYGQHKATLCGLAHSKGKYVVTMDDDLEHDPRDIIQLLQKFKESNASVVYGVATNKRRGLIKDSLVCIYKWISKIENADAGSGSSFRIISAELACSLKEHGTHLFFLDEMLLWYTDQIETERVIFRKSKKKISGYSYNGLFSLSKNVFMISTTMPLQLVKFLGLSVSSVSFLYGIFHLFHKLFFKTEKGYTSLIISILFSTGLLLLCIGIIGEYLSNLLIMNNKKPAYSIKEKI